MYKEDVYRAVAAEFSVGVGVATTFRVSEVANDPHVERSAEDRARYRAVSDEWRINRIIGEAVGRGRYRELTRGLFWSQQKNPKWPVRRHYTTTWSALSGRRSRKKGVSV